MKSFQRGVHTAMRVRECRTTRNDLATAAEVAFGQLCVHAAYAVLCSTCRMHARAASEETRRTMKEETIFYFLFSFIHTAYLVKPRRRRQRDAA